ncbi:hypothetical protein Rhopal_005274-T1 [Rhodotorula paludigena]|uniref:Protein phosphatase n=1 Tax=Rhodotorula paludigena TaxID=86838 RepID=A0AAV5GP43_9BASI|nr:hypothetical protein Rhopal_005274-T1 [Rhodotorula paludigena]
MSKSPKALLPSTIPLASLSRALSASSSASTSTYSVRAVARPHGARRVDAQGQAQPAFIVVRQRKVPSSSLSGTRPSRPSPPSPASSDAATGSVRRSASVSTAGVATRPSRAAASGLIPSSTASSRSLAGYFDASSTARQFHSSCPTHHQQAISPASGGIDLPPGTGAPPSPPASSAAEGPAFQPKHHTSLTTPATDGPLLVGPAPGQSGHGPSLALDPSAASSSLASTSTSQSAPPTSSSAPPASLFSHSLPSQLPPHALPSFFGSALNIARRSNLVFRNGAYGIPKPDRYRSPPPAGKGKQKAIISPEQTEAEHYLSVGVGEDSYFLRADSLGVADGVGGWSGHAGANSARWARKFMHHCSAELARYENVDDELFLQYYEVDPVDVMQRAYEKTLTECKDEGTIGSSTAMLAILRNDELRLANLGDCSCCVIRGDEYIYRSEEQQHRFNYPFQAGTNAKDTPAKDAQKATIKVRRDDIVILASDGLVDNVFSDDLLEEVLRFVGTNPSASARLSPSSNGQQPGAGAAAAPRFSLRRFSPQAVSEALCFRAKSVYEDQRAVASPFQQRAMEEGIHYAGGKVDDVSCLVGVVGELEAAPNRRDVQ